MIQTLSLDGVSRFEFWILSLSGIWDLVLGAFLERVLAAQQVYGTIVTRIVVARSRRKERVYAGIGCHRDHGAFAHPERTR
jgi:hypothetical protein